MDRNSCIFYKSFYDSIKELASEEQVQIYNAIFEYQFNGKTIELSKVCKSIFTLIIPQLEANNKRYINGCKGGRPKNNQNETKEKPNKNQKETKKKPNDNENDNVNENDKENNNYNDNDLYSYIEQNFGRTLNPIEYEKINEWGDNELTRYAIKKAILNGAYSLKYIDKILYNYNKKGITTVEQAKQEEQEYNQLKEDVQENKYDWLEE